MPKVVKAKVGALVKMGVGNGMSQGANTRQIMFDLENELRKKNHQIGRKVTLEQLKNNNFRLQDENEAIRVLKNKIHNLELENSRNVQQISFFEKQTSQLKSDNEALGKQLSQSRQNLSQVIGRSKEQFLVQNFNGKPEYAYRYTIGL